jgi:hypothetical protein
MLALEDRADTVRHLVKTDLDPRVGRRAPALFMRAQGELVLAVARGAAPRRTAPHRVRAWRGGSWRVDPDRGS